MEMKRAHVLRLGFSQAEKISGEKIAKIVVLPNSLGNVFVTVSGRAVALAKGKMPSCIYADLADAQEDLISEKYKKIK
jgi:hypothetical protein